MAEQAQRGFLQQQMSDFVTGPAWVPSAPGPTGHARPRGNRLEDSPVMKWSLDALDWAKPRNSARLALRRAKGDARTQARTTLHDSVLPGLEAARDTLIGEGYEVELEAGTDTATLRVVNYNGSELTYTVEAHVYSEAAASLADVYRSVGRRYPAIEVVSRGRRRRRSPAACARQAIERDCLYETHKALLW